MEQEQSNVAPIGAVEARELMLQRREQRKKENFKRALGDAYQAIHHFVNEGEDHTSLPIADAVLDAVFQELRQRGFEVSLAEDGQPIPVNWYGPTVAGAVKSVVISWANAVDKAV